MPECEFLDLCFDAHMMLAEKEMLYKDSFCIVAGIEDGQDSCIMYLLVKGYLNSPQFKKKYALQDNCDTLAELREQVGWERGYEQGQQNPDPKQYAKREELVEAKGEMDKAQGWVKSATDNIRRWVKELNQEHECHKKGHSLPSSACVLLGRIHEETYQIETDVSTGSRRANAIIDNTANKEKDDRTHGLED